MNIKKFTVRLKLEIPLEFVVNANNENEAFDIATDNAMEYIEKKISDSRKFDEFWEYEVQSNLVSSEEKKSSD